MRLRALAATGLITAVAMAVPIPQAATAQPGATTTNFGVHEFNIAAKGGEPNRTSEVTEVGASFVRLPVTWHLMEAGGKGQTADWFWQEMDADIAAAEAAGLGVLITFGQTPCWASSDPAKNCDNEALTGIDPDTGTPTYLSYLPSNPQDYADAFGRMVERYGDRVMAWEVWNEPNLAGNLRADRCPDLGACERPAAENDEYNMFGDLGSAYEYAELVRLAAASAVSADPNAKVLAGSIAGGDEVFLEHMYNAGLGDDYFAVSAHPYTGPIPGDANGTSYGPTECPTTDRNADFWCFENGINELHNEMLANGDGRDIWFTEFGFSSTDVWNGSGYEGQAIHLSEAVALIETWDFVPVAAWYQLVDQSEDDREGRFGLFDQAGNIKPAGEAYRDALTGTPANPDTIEVLGPFAEIGEDFPAFEWTSVNGATSYLLWVNQYGDNETPGIINLELSPADLGCQDGGVCSIVPYTFVWPGGEFWVIAYFEDGSSIESEGASFFH